MHFVKGFHRCFLPAVVMLALFSCIEERLQPPVAVHTDHLLTIHGHTRNDPYYWLNRREDPKVIEYLKAENAYTESVMKHTRPLQEQLYQEMVSRIPQTDLSVPFPLNGYVYYTRYSESNEYPLICRKKDHPDAEEEIMLDVNEMAAGFSFFHVGDWEVSPDSKLVAFSVDTVSRRKYTLMVKDLVSGNLLPDRIGNISGSITWANDNRTLFYTLKDETLRPFQVFTHILSQNPAQDRLVFEESDPTYSVYVTRSKSDRYIMIHSESTLSSETRILEADQPGGQFRVFHPRENDLLYSVAHHGDRFFILTNLDARNFRLMETPAGQTERSYWKEVIPHRDDVLIQDMEVFRSYLALEEKREGLDRIRIIDLEGGTDRYLEFGEETYTLYFTDNREFGTELLRFGYSSLTTPKSVFDHNMRNGERTLMKRQEVLGGFSPLEYHSERLYALAMDGSRIPISLVYRKGLRKEGSNPLWITGYGAYGYSTEPFFAGDRLSLLDRGFIFAIAHVRGGQEMGRSWYEEGKLLNKKNTFTDFIACTEFLIREGYSQPDLTFAWGGSAGGLLIGAVMNMRPELYRGMVAAVPFVDVVTTMLDESVPLTTSEYDEWGNPNRKEYYDYMLSYSPYDNVKPADYPNLLVTTGLHDSQVQYWEPAKWVARLRSMKTDQNLLLLLTQMEYGHGGASGRFERYHEKALEYAFVLDLLDYGK
ncbi:MAG: S9 family peptidase [Bacteroidales bacterium]|nr:S9 family peptidase [Bacteroidales bacterium]